MPDVPLSVYKPADRKFYYCQWVDPVTQRPVTRSTKEDDEKKANRRAVEIQRKELAKSTNPTRTTWEDLKKAYKASQYPSQREKTKAKTEATIRAVDVHMRPAFVDQMTAVAILKFQTALRNRDLSEYTVKGHLAELRKILRWSLDADLLQKMPVIRMPKVMHAKGRAPTEEEFERLLQKVEAVVGHDAAPSWTYLLNGLWWSGLRLSEAMALRWTGDNLAKFWIAMDGPRPMFHSAATFDKSGRDRIFPVAKEFFDFLNKTPQRGRRGHVFTPMPWGESDAAARPSIERVGKTIAKIGELAGVKVAAKKKRIKSKFGEIKVEEVPKYATAHDLRRSFGVRWSQRVLQPVLMELMRHESIQTTMQFYVGRNAVTAADQAWNAVPDKTEVQAPAKAAH